MVIYSRREGRCGWDETSGVVDKVLFLDLTGVHFRIVYEVIIAVLEKMDK